MPSTLAAGGSVPDPERQFNADQLFSLKEWMAAISAKLDRLETKLDTKADIQHVQAIDLRVGQLEKQAVEGRTEAQFYLPQHTRMLEDVGVLKQKMSSLASVESYRRWVFGTVFIALLSLITSILLALLK